LADARCYYSTVSVHFAYVPQNEILIDLGNSLSVSGSSQVKLDENLVQFFSKHDGMHPGDTAPKAEISQR
jgi:hypothetical protein